jgi:hypothetical protein
MEGPALAFKVLVLTAIIVAIYRKFERVHLPFPDFERFIRTQPVLVAIRSHDASAIAERIRAALDGDRAFAGTGQRPWPFYALRLAVEMSPGLVVIRTRDCALLRVEGKDPPQLLTIVREAIAGHEAEVWVHGAVWVDLDHGVRSETGWVLGTDLQPCDAVPAWVTGAASADRALIAQSSPPCATSLT